MASDTASLLKLFLPDLSNIKIGDVVAPHDHPYHPSLTTAIISGEHLLISPLMTVIERKGKLSRSILAFKKC